MPPFKPTTLELPSVGHPVTLNEDGSVSIKTGLPFVGDITVSAEDAAKLVAAYLAAKPK